MLHHFSVRPRAAAIIMLLAFALSAVTPSALGWTLEEMLNPPYFDAADIRDVRKGGFGVARIREVSDREIAVVIACLVQVPSEEALAPFLGDSLPVDPQHLRDQKLIDPDLPDESFRAVSLGSDSRDEIRHYLEAHPGLGLNLSSEEISAFQALRDVNDPVAVEATLEDILHRRYLAYREAGLDGAIPYARENGEQVSPGAELRRTEEEMLGLHEIYPEFHNAWLRYPASVLEDIVRDDYFWLKLDIEDRPAFVLSHRLEAANEDTHLVGIRDYYMSHFFDVSQRVAVVTRLESGENIMIYLERAGVPEKENRSQGPHQTDGASSPGTRYLRHLTPFRN